METKGLGNICKSSITTTQLCFDTQLPKQLKQYFDSKDLSSDLDKYLEAGPAKSIWFQFKAQSTREQRLALIKELFFPNKQRIKEKYPDSRLPIPFLYIRRAVSGTLHRIFK